MRNYVLILPASVCASDTTRIVAQQVNGAVTFNNQQGCSQVESDVLQGGELPDFAAGVKFHHFALGDGFDGHHHVVGGVNAHCV